VYKLEKVLPRFENICNSKSQVEEITFKTFDEFKGPDTLYISSVGEAAEAASRYVLICSCRMKLQAFMGSAPVIG